MDKDRGFTGASALTDTRAARPAIVSRGFRGVQAGDFRRHWVRNDPFDTAFFNALSAVFPHGETFMIRTMIPWVNRLPEPLRSEAEAFIEQEAGHSREHVGMNRGLIEAGYDIEPLEKRIRGFAKFFDSANDLIKLTVTMCTEHFTAIIAAEILENDWHLDGAPEDTRELWIWHAVEEVEHKAVAFDVWRYATRDWSAARRWVVRSAFMQAITASFFFNRTAGQLELLRQDGMGRWPALKGIFRSGFGKGGIGRNVLRPWLAFFRPGFHPWDLDDRVLLAKGEAMLATSKARRAGFDPAPMALPVSAEQSPKAKQAA